MADPVFALSPISARSAAPTEADYEAIREAFMETARGRWFLTEYAKRNRNADTNLVLEAVSRLEATLASQKQDQRDRTQEVIAAIHALVIEARSEAAVLISVRDTPDEDSPALKGVRVLREMAWTLRESGTDGRIPDLLSRQADAIEEGLKAAIDETARDHLLSIFDRLAGDVEALGGGEAAGGGSPEQASAIADPEPAQQTAAAAEDATVETLAAESAAPETAAFAAPQAVATDAVAERTPAIAESDTLSEQAMDVHAALAPEQEEQLAALHASMEEAELIWDEPAEKAVADEAVAETAVDLMAIDATAAAEGLTAATSESRSEAETHAAIEALTRIETPAGTAVPQALPETRSMSADAISTDRMAALEAAIMAPAADQTSLSRQPDMVSPGSAPETAMSLGAALLKKGIVTRPDTPRADPLAPFKRMTQAERVAFFS